MYPFFKKKCLFDSLALFHVEDKLKKEELL